MTLSKITAGLILVLASLTAQADIRSDLADPNLSLAQVLNNALASGESLQAAIAEMIAIEPSLAQSIVATALLTEPGAAAEIVTAAVGAGMDPAAAVSVALIANTGVDPQTIIAAAVNASPESTHGAIANAATTALAKRLTKPVIEPARATLLPVAAIRAAGGGAAFTVAENRAVRAVLDQIEAQLQDLGLGDIELTQQVSSVIGQLTEAKTDVTTSVAALQKIKLDLTAAEDKENKPHFLKNGQVW